MPSKVHNKMQLVEKKIALHIHQTSAHADSPLLISLTLGTHP